MEAVLITISYERKTGKVIKEVIEEKCKVDITPLAEVIYKSMIAKN